MKRLIIVCIGGVGAYVLVAGTSYGALAQGDSAPNSYVKLQSTTPGTQQAGHVNVDGEGNAPGNAYEIFWLETIWDRCWCPDVPSLRL